MILNLTISKFYGKMTLYKKDKNIQPITFKLNFNL